MSPLYLGADRSAGQDLATRIASTDRLLVVFFADWCPFCQAFAPLAAARVPRLGLEAVAGDLSDPRSDGWDEYAIEVIPTLVVYEGGIEVRRVEAKAGVGLDEQSFDEILK